jgi:diguanylate cyclase (GGDEF)-like protein/PAS domain S-box-containing protein
MHMPPKQHLHLKLARSVLSAALLLAALCSVALFATELQRATQETEARLAQLLDTVESSAAVAAYSGNQALGEDVLRSLMRNDIVHAVRLSNDRGLDLRLTREGPILAQHERVRVLHSPFGEAEAIGQLAAIPHDLRNLQEALHGSLLGAASSSVLIGLTALLVLARVRSSLSLPLTRASHALHAIKAGEQERLPMLGRHRDDELGQLVQDINGLLDTLEEKFAAERQLREEVQSVGQRLRDIFENTSAGIFLLDASGKLQTANPTLGRVLGFKNLTAEVLLGRDFPTLACAEPEQFHAQMREASVLGRAVAMDLKLRNPRGDSPRWAHCLISKRLDAQGAVRYEGVVYDITERRVQELKVQHEAEHDPLTSLLRRHAAERKLSRLLEAPPTPGQAHAVLLIDLDEFKAVNDTYGHDAGDAVLAETARRIKSCVREGDIAARLGGDEFLVALADCAPPERACQVARSLVSALTRPILLKSGPATQIGASVGIALHTGNGQPLEDLLKTADRAMYEAKRRGKNGYALALPEGGFRAERLELGSGWL